MTDPNIPETIAVTMIEIGGQIMTEAQFNAAQYPLLHPNPGPAIPKTNIHGSAENAQRMRDELGIYTGSTQPNDADPIQNDAVLRTLLGEVARDVFAGANWARDVVTQVPGHFVWRVFVSHRPSNIMGDFTVADHEIGKPYREVRARLHQKALDLRQDILVEANPIKR